MQIVDASQLLKEAGKIYLRPKFKNLFGADILRRHDTTEAKQICREQETCLEDHQLRISRLEK